MNIKDFDHPTEEPSIVERLQQSRAWIQEEQRSYTPGSIVHQQYQAVIDLIDSMLSDIDGGTILQREGQ